MNTTIQNALIVTENEILHGTAHIVGERITAVDPYVESESSTIDFNGDYLLPGLIDCHTDNLEHFAQPRPGVKWPSMLSALLAHDWQLIGSGITTALDAMATGDYDRSGARAALLDEAVGSLIKARAAGLLRADHHLHLRCELSDPDLPFIIGRYIDTPELRLVSMMDHTPGQRQWRNLAMYREFRRKKNGRIWSEDEFTAYMAERLERQKQCVPHNRAVIGQLCRDRNVRTASHDDTTIADVEGSGSQGIAICEFPTTVTAACEARTRGMKVVMGSPNVVLGGSHSGNVSAVELAREGLLDTLTSDYVPGSLLQAPFALAAAGFDLAEAIRMVTANPADMLGFSDRGRVAAGYRADLLRVNLVDGVPVIKAIWVAGQRCF